MRTILLVILVSLCAISTIAATGKPVSYKSSDESVQGILYAPEGHLAADAASLNSLKKINAAVLGVFGGQDRSIPVDDVKKFEQTLKQQGNKVEIVIYPDAGHAFENPNNKTGYRADDAADAWKHTTSFLAGTLKK